MRRSASCPCKLNQRGLLHGLHKAISYPDIVTQLQIEAISKIDTVQGAVCFASYDYPDYIMNGDITDLGACLACPSEPCVNTEVVYNLEQEKVLTNRAIELFLKIRKARRKLNFTNLED